MFELFFITSSSLKLNHAAYILRDYNIKISRQRNYGIGYIEPRISNRQKLHHDSLKDARFRWGKTISKSDDKFFFIEDTSVIIHSLSKDNEYPGVDVKYWMRENDFITVDKMLKDAGNNRTVTVRSDVILYVPNDLFSTVDPTKYDKKVTLDGDGYITFTGSVDGVITDKEFIFNTNPLYPWLDNKTFNKWFVPQGADLPISMLPIDTTDIYDFRKQAIDKMVQFLCEYNLVKPKISSDVNGQNKYFEFCNEPLLLVSGLPCAGKTTLGANLQLSSGYYHIEASDFMFLSYYRHHGTSSNVSIGDFAEKALNDNPIIVVDQIINHLKSLPSIPVIISGFRSPKELDAFNIMYSGPYDIKCIYIDAEANIRYSRSLERGRYDQAIDFDKFLSRDMQQLSMGLDQIKNDIHVNVITNNVSLYEFIDCVKNIYHLDNVVLTNLPVIVNRPSSLHDSILISLLLHEDKLDYFTTAGIANIINNMFLNSKLKANKNNVSRFFNQAFYPYFEILTSTGLSKYRLSETGISHALYLLSKYCKNIKNSSDFYNAQDIYDNISSRFIDTKAIFDT